MQRTQSFRSVVTRGVGRRSSSFVVALAFALWGASVVEISAGDYVVRKSDTLSSIARSHGLSVSQLIQANGLSRSGHIQVGQRLQIPTPRTRLGSSSSPKPSTRKPLPTSRSIPSPSTGLSASESSSLPPSVRRSVDRTRITSGRWDYIVIHHSATPVGTAFGMDRYHREQRHMENGLAYHFVVGNGRGMGDGQIAIGQRWTRQINGGHLASEALNARSLGICLVGNFDRDHPSKRQLDSLKALTEYLMKRCGIPRTAVKTHQQINPIGTRCPGRLFDDETFVRSLRTSDWVRSEAGRSRGSRTGSLSERP